MSTQNFSIDCLDLLCPDGSLGAAGVSNKFCDEPEQSEVNSLVMWHPTLGTAPLNWGPSMVLADFTIDNSNADDTAQKRFFGRGNLAASESLEVTTNDFNQAQLRRTFTLNFVIFNVNQATRDYFRKIQCGKVKPYFDYTTVEQNIFGADGGIKPTRYNIDMPLEEGEESIEQITVEIQWKARVSPDKFPSPLE